MKQYQRGFTVLELMVAVVIVGLLATVAVPAFTAEASKSKQTEAKLQLEKLAHSAVAYFNEHRKFPQGTAQVLPGEDGAACSEPTKQFAVSTAWGADSVVVTRLLDRRVVAVLVSLHGDCAEIGARVGHRRHLV